MLVLYCVYNFDACGHKRNRDTWFYFLLIVFIIISGFAYRLGYDNANYMSEFPMYRMNGGYGWEELTSYSGRQPLWVLMTKICKAIVNKYWFFKLAHSLLINTLIFFAFRRLTKYVFTAILFYFVLVYFDYNFQVMRQSIAVALFMSSISKYKDNKWLPYYLINILGFLFHEAAIITFLLPFIKLMKISVLSISAFFDLSIAGVLGGSFLVETLLPNVMDLFIGDKALYYMSQMDDESAVIGLNIILSVLIPLVFILKKVRNNSVGINDYFVMIYGLLYGLGLNVPIIYRLNQFFILFFYICYIEIFAQLAIWAKSKLGVNAKRTFICVCLLFLTYRARMYLLPFAGSDIPSYAQFYPYHSILFEMKDPTREALLMR